MSSQTNVNIHCYSSSTENDAAVNLLMFGNNSNNDQITNANIQSLASAIEAIIQDQYNDPTCVLWDITVATRDNYGVTLP